MKDSTSSAFCAGDKVIVLVTPAGKQAKAVGKIGEIIQRGSLFWEVQVDGFKRPLLFHTNEIEKATEIRKA